MAHIPRVLSFAVEEKLVITAVRADYNHRIIVRPKGAYARRALWDGELAEGPVAGKVFGNDRRGTTPTAAFRVSLRLFQVEDVDRSVVRGHHQVRRLVVEVYAVDVRR